MNRTPVLLAGAAIGASFVTQVMTRRAQLAHPPLGSHVHGLHFIERGFCMRLSKGSASRAR